MAHARRRFFDLYEAIKSPLAKEALDRIAVLYQIEDKIRGCAPDQRRGVRQAHAVPVLNALHAWMMEKVSQVGRNTDLGSAFNYSLNRWESLCRYTQDGRLSIDKAMISYCTSLVGLSWASVASVHCTAKIGFGQVNILGRSVEAAASVAVIFT